MESTQSVGIESDNVDVNFPILYDQISWSMPNLSKNGVCVRKSHRYMSTAFLRKYIDIDTYMESKDDSEDNVLEKDTYIQKLSSNEKHTKSLCEELFISNTKNDASPTNNSTTPTILLNSFTYPQALSNKVPCTCTICMNIAETEKGDRIRRSHSEENIHERTNEVDTLEIKYGASEDFRRSASDDNLLHTINIDEEQYFGRANFYKRHRSADADIIFYTL